MASQLTGIILRLPNGVPLTDAQGDNNLTLIQNFVNGQANIVAASLNPDGTLKASAINAISQFATLPLFSDTFALNETLPTSSFSGGNYTVTNANVTALSVGSRVAWKADLVNTGNDTVTFTNGTTPLSPVPIVKGASTALVAGDILAGQVVEGIFDGSLLHLMQQANIFASAKDILAGTDATKVVTAAALKSASLSFTSALIPIPGAGTPISPVSHGLLQQPTRLRGVMKCLTSELDYIIGDEVELYNCFASGSNFPNFTVRCSATAINCVQTGVTIIADAITGSVSSPITPANWNLKFYAGV